MKVTVLITLVHTHVIRPRNIRSGCATVLLTNARDNSTDGENGFILGPGSVAFVLTAG